MYYVYLLESKKYDEIYVGSTNDLRRRLGEHNNGKEISTKRYMPWLLVSYEAYQSEKDARHREKMLKQHGNAMRQFKIKSQNSFNKKRASPSTIFLPKKNSAGFTLIETLIYIAIIGGVMATFISFGLGIAQNRNKVFAKQEVQANARVALDIIGQKIKMSNGINIASSTFDADPGVLSLSMNDGDIDPTIIDLSVDDGILQITQGIGDPIFITSDKVKITNLVFTNLSGDSASGNIKIDITVEYDSAGDTSFNYSQDITTAVSLRK